MVKFEVHAYTWSKIAAADALCKDASCLHYAHQFGLSDNQSATLRQNQSWPVLFVWKSSVPVTVPALGITTPSANGKVYFNPWRDMEIAFCHDQQCETRIAIEIAESVDRNDCVAQALDGMHALQPHWLQSQGEAYGVSNLEGDYCTNWMCTDSAPTQACFGTNHPNTQECAEGGCECNLDAWFHTAENTLEYRAIVSAIRGVRAPWFADRWETGGLYAVNDGDTIFRMSTRVSLSDPELAFRPVIDMRTDWNGSWEAIPRPDGWEGPPIFRNSINEFIAPSDGYWPITWEVALDSSVSEAWMQPVWNVIVKPGGETGTASFQDLAFEACGSAVSEIICTYEGCTH